MTAREVAMMDETEREAISSGYSWIDASAARLAAWHTSLSDRCEMVRAAQAPGDDPFRAHVRMEIDRRYGA